MIFVGIVFSIYESEISNLVNFNKVLSPASPTMSKAISNIPPPSPEYISSEFAVYDIILSVSL